MARRHHKVERCKKCGATFLIDREWSRVDCPECDGRSFEEIAAVVVETGGAEPQLIRRRPRDRLWCQLSLGEEERQGIPLFRDKLSGDFMLSVEPSVTVDLSKYVPPLGSGASPLGALGFKGVNALLCLRKLSEPDWGLLKAVFGEMARLVKHHLQQGAARLSPRK